MLPLAVQPRRRQPRVGVRVAARRRPRGAGAAPARPAASLAGRHVRRRDDAQVRAGRRVGHEADRLGSRPK